MYAELRSKGMPNLAAADLFQVKGKVALVTGGGRGIGFMIAAGLVQNGATVYITSRKAAACEQAARELSGLSNGSGGSCIALPPMDLADGVNAEQKLKEALAAAGVSKMNILVNNSGTSWGQPFDQFEEKGWDRVMNLNVRAVFYVTRACLPLLKAAASKDCKSRIINIGSVAGLDCQVVPTYSYDVSKAAVHHLTRKFAAEFAYNDITCNAVAPGLVPSLMSDQLLSYASQDALESSIPLKRVGSMEDMAGVALFLCSRAGEWVTGTIIPVDGGALLSKL